MAQIKFKKYDTLRKQLSNSGISNAGKTARVLLECFVHLNGMLKADYVEGCGLCKHGEFKKWRSQLEAAGYLNWSHGDFSRHTPGVRLVPLVNAEKAWRNETATIPELAALEARSDEKYVARELHEELKDDLAETKDDLAETKDDLAKTNSLLEETRREFSQTKARLEARMCGAEIKIAKLIEDLDPPGTDEKVQGFFAGTYELPTGRS